MDNKKKETDANQSSTSPVTSEDILLEHGFDGIDENTKIDVDDTRKNVRDSEIIKENINLGEEQDEHTASKTQDEKEPEKTKKGKKEDVPSDITAETAEASAKIVPKIKLIVEFTQSLTNEEEYNNNIIDNIFSNIDENEAYEMTNRNASEITTNADLLVVDGVGRTGKSTHTRSIRMVRDSSLSSRNTKYIEDRVYTENFSETKKALTRCKDVTVDELKWLTIGADKEYTDKILKSIRDDGGSHNEDVLYYSEGDINNRASLLAKTLTHMIKYINNNLVVVSKVKKNDNEGEVFVFFEEDDKRLYSNIQVSFSVLQDGKSVLFAIKLNKAILDEEEVAYTLMFAKLNTMFKEAKFSYTMEEIETKGLYTTFGVELDLDIKYVVPVILLSSNIVVSSWNTSNVIVPNSSKASSAYIKGGASVGSVPIISKLSIFGRRYAKTMTLEYLDQFNSDNADLISANCNYVQLSGNHANVDNIADSNIGEIRFRDSNIVEPGVTLSEDLYRLITALRNNFNMSKKPSIAKLVVSVTRFSRIMNTFMSQMDTPNKVKEETHTINLCMNYFCSKLDEELQQTGVICNDLTQIMTSNELSRMHLDK